MYNALFLKVVGISVFNIRLFNQIVALLVIIVTYVFCKKKFGIIPALTACSLMLCQPIFFVQSHMVLPEIMLSFFLLGGSFLFIFRNYLLACLFFTLAILTKETALPIPFCLATFAMIYCSLKCKHLAFKKLIMLRMVYIIPFSVLGIFFLIQKNTNGWYLFPLHESFIGFDLKEIAARACTYFKFIFLEQGRCLNTAVLLVFITKHIVNATVNTIFPKSLHLDESCTCCRNPTRNLYTYLSCQ